MHAWHTLVAFTDTIKLDLDRNADLLEYICTSDTGALENTRGAECACRDDYELLRADCSYLSLVCVRLEDGVCSILDANSALASGERRSLSTRKTKCHRIHSLEDHPLHEGSGQDLEARVLEMVVQIMVSHIGTLAGLPVDEPSRAP